MTEAREDGAESRSDVQESVNVRPAILRGGVVIIYSAACVEFCVLDIPQPGFSRL